jgi:hypothetical protein
MTTLLDTNATFTVQQNSALMIGFSVLILPLWALFVFGTWASFSYGPGWLLALSAAMAVVFGFTIVALVREARDWDKTVVTLSPQGYHDMRVSPFTFPWPHIHKITVGFWNRRHVRLTLSETMAPHVGRPGLIGRLQRVDRLSLRPTVVTNTLFLRTRAAQLAKAAQAYAAAHGVPQNRI